MSSAPKFRKTLQISSLDAAKRELEYAIKLFLNYGDVVIIHLIICASQSILLKLRDPDHVESVRDTLNRSIIPSKRKEVMDIINKPYNFFKHADVDVTKSLTFNPESSEIIIFDCVNLYFSIAKEQTGLMMAFKTWFFAKYKNKVLRSELQQDFDQSLVELGFVDVSNRAFFLNLVKEYENRLI